MTTSFERVQNWLQSTTAFSLPQLNDEGLSRAVINNDCIVHLVASPNPNPYAKDDFFIYVPVASAELITKDNAEKFLHFLGEQNMMASLPTGFRLGMNKENYFWLSGRFSTEYMTLHDFETIIKECIVAAEFLMKEIQNIATESLQFSAPDSAPDMAQNSFRGSPMVLWG